jgi:Domain of unknown function (DUF4160)
VRHRDTGRFVVGHELADPPMPIIASFFGIYVRMYFADHAPPHVHIEYQGRQALVAVSDGSVIEGSLPRRAALLVQQWCVDHRAELEQNWRRAQALLPLDRIPGADHD